MIDAPGAVLDASALLALLREEPGAEAVEAHLGGAVISAVNWSETYGLLRTAGAGRRSLDRIFEELAIEVEPFLHEDAVRAGELFVTTRGAGLSLADRACLALAHRLAVPALTADRAWLGVDAGVEVVCIR